MSSKRKNKLSKKAFWIISTAVLIGGAIGICCWYFLVYQKEEIKDSIISKDTFKINNENGFISNNYAFVNANVIDNPSSDSDIAYIRKRVSDHNLIGFDLSVSNDSTYRIGHWNTLNFSLLKTSDLSDKSSDRYLHALNIAKVINYFKFDIIGLTEINANTVKENDTSAATNFLNMVNDYVPTSLKDKYQYDLIVSNNTKSITATSGQIEQVAILYNKVKVKNNETTNDDSVYGNGYFYQNNPINWGLTDKTKKDYDYVRPPFGTSFQIVENNQMYNLALLYSHFDSPGASANEDKGTNGMGTQEMFEANNVDVAIQEFQKRYNTNNVVFMGDTNIPTGKQNIAFNTNQLSQLGYQFAFEDNSNYNTSLATVKTVESNLNNPIKWYSNAYDKIIYSLSDFKINQNDSYQNLIEGYIKTNAQMHLFNTQKEFL